MIPQPLHRPAILLLLALLPNLAASGQPHNPAAPTRGVTEYIAGMDSLEAGNWPTAIASLSKAVDADADNATYIRARGVANTLAEKFNDALDDLQRAYRLTRGADQETRLWMAAAYRMSGNPAEGAKHFTHGRDVPAPYASLIYNDMAMDYWQSRTHGTYFDRKLKKQVEVKEPVRTLFKEVAGKYVDRHRPAGGAAFEAVLKRVNESIARRDHAAALRDLRSLMASAPEDEKVIAATAACYLGVGDGLSARREATRLLSNPPAARWAQGYLIRAEASALIGDRRRTEADLATLQRLGATVDETTRARISQRLAAQPTSDPATRLEKLAGDNAALEAQVSTAIDCLRWHNNRRARYDEAYQDRIRVIAETIATQARHPGHHETMGRFLLNHHRVPTLWNGPRAVEKVRPQSENQKKRELSGAVAFADAALTLDPKHHNAMATKGWTLYVLGNSAGASALADQGLAIEKRNIRLLQLKSRLLLDAAAAMESQAAALRAGRTETTTERRSDGIYEVTRRYPPTPQQLAEALALEQRAKENRIAANSLMSDRQTIIDKTIPAMIADGDAALAKDDLAAARAAHEQTLQLAADHIDAMRKLAVVCLKQRDSTAHSLYSLLSQPMLHTTAAGELKTAWDEISRTAFGAGEQALTRASAIDSVDARIPAYLSVAAAGRKDSAAAEKHRVTALALEEARARLMGNSFLPAGKPQVAPDDVAMTLLLNVQTGRAELRAGKPDRALDAFARNVAIEQRLVKDDFHRIVSTAMVPDPTLAPGNLPNAPSIARLMAESHLGTGTALNQLGRGAEAEKELDRVREYVARWPSTAPGRETLYIVDAWARLGQAQAAVAQKQLDKAHLILNSGEGWPGGLPPELDSQRKSLAEQVRKARFQAQTESLEADSKLTPDQLRRRRAEEDIRAFEKELESTLRELADPNLSEADKRALNQVRQTLEKQIAQRKTALERLPSTPERNPRRQ